MWKLGRNERGEGEMVWVVLGVFLRMKLDV